MRLHSFQRGTGFEAYSETHIGEMMYSAISNYTWDGTFDTKSLSDTIDTTNVELYQELARKSSSTFANHIDDYYASECRSPLAIMIES